MPYPVRPAAATLAAALFAALPADADVPAVATDTPVVHALALMVMGDLGTPVLLLDRGADAHDFQLRPSQLRALRSAGLVVWTGTRMTPWLGHALEAGHAGQALALIDVPGTALRDYGGDGDDQATEHATEESHEHSHDHVGTDPHAWLDPGNAAVWTAAIAEALAGLDAQNAGTYRANARAAGDRIMALDAALAGRLAPARGQGLLLAHDAYGYFADRYGLTIVGSLAEGDAADPGAAHLSELRHHAEAGEVACAFPEAGRDPRAIENVIAGTPARMGRPLDPEGRSAEPGPDLYLGLLDGIGTAIADCIAAR